MTWIAVGIGGAVGSMLRHGMNGIVAHAIGRPSPYATLAVNVIGCAAIGLLAGLLASGRMQMSGPERAFVFVGILGGFTTYSSFGLDTFTLAHTGHAAAAFWNVAAHIVLGLGAVYAAYALAS
jgi:CrcB protein